MKLSITIPTYNRMHLLRKTLEVVLPQLTADTELLICDNASPDETSAYLRALGCHVRIFRQHTNVGPDRNFLSCIEQARGDYVWTLCDDDLPTSNAVDTILQAVRKQDAPGLVYLRAAPSDERVSTYDRRPVSADWEEKSVDAFLLDVAEWVTFASSIVVKRELVDVGFLRKQLDTSLVPAALALQVAGNGGRVLISRNPLVFVRGGNSAGYDAFTVFTKHLRQLLEQSRPFGYKAASLEAVFRGSVQKVLCYLAAVWRPNLRGLANLILYSWRYGVLYRRILPRLARRFTVRLVARMLSVATAIAARVGGRMYSLLQQLLNDSATWAFRRAVKPSDQTHRVCHPVYLRNPQYLRVGRNFVAGPGLRMEAWDEYCGEHFKPTIEIADNVCVNWNVHIGAINRIEIRSGVLIGSHVLITDHAHGSLRSEEVEIPPARRPLCSKGPVLIEENVWIGEGVCVLPGVTIGHGAIIGANAVVTSNVPPGSIVGGVPAKTLRTLASGRK
jgi:acetyltransferase-like isoleucine patch superfamily enzyme